VLLADVAHPHDAALCAEKSSPRSMRRIASPDTTCASPRVSASRLTPAMRPMPRRLLQNADFAMYRPNTRAQQLSILQTRDECQCHRTQSVETDLRQAISRHEFILNYQPKVNLATGAVVGVEALITLATPDARPHAAAAIHSDRRGIGTHSSDRPMGVGHRLSASAHLQDDGLFPMSMAINVSAVRVARQGFPHERASDPRAVALGAALSRARADRNITCCRTGNRPRISCARSRPWA